MFEQDSQQFEMGQELSNSHEKPVVEIEKEKDGMTVEEIDDKFNEMSRNVYLELLSKVETSFQDNKITKEKYEEMIKRIDDLSEKELGYKITEKYTSPEKAKEILGNDYLGPKDVEETFGVEIKNIPPIPFGLEDIKRAKELGQFLIFRTDKITKDKLGLPNYYTLKNSQTNHWALVSKDFVPDTMNKNYIEQIDEMIKYLQNQIFNNKKLPTEYKEAIDEFESQKQEIKEKIEMKDLFNKRSEEILKSLVERISNLKINRLIRRSTEQVYYDLQIFCKKNVGRLLEDCYDWTYSRTYDDEQFEAVGLHEGFKNVPIIEIEQFYPVGGDSLGSCLSRTI